MDFQMLRKITGYEFLQNERCELWIIVPVGNQNDVRSPRAVTFNPERIAASRFG